MTRVRIAHVFVVIALTVSACVNGSPAEPTPTIAPPVTPGTTLSGSDPDAGEPQGAEDARDVEAVSCDDAPDEVAIVCEAYELIEANYVDDVSNEALVEAAVQGLDLIDGGSSSDEIVCALPFDEFEPVCDAAAETGISAAETAEAIVSSFALFGLDPNSAYLDADALDLIEQEQEGEIEGIGAFVSPEDQTIEGENKQCAVISDTCRISIVSTIEGTPAEAVGLEEGDVIVGVDGRDIRGWTVDEVTAAVRGPAGTEVDLTIERGPDTFDVSLIRAAVVIPVIEIDRFGDDGYIRLRAFTGTADEQFQSAVIDMIAAGIDDLVVDLRNNPGGLLDTAIEVASVFLPSGDVVVTEGPNDDISYPVTGNSVIPEDVNVVFIVNAGSASASEVVSAVLQERGRALVVGENTFGKNTVQQRFGLSNGGALKLTIARWLTPDGLDFGGVGITPDVAMTFDAQTEPEEIVAMVVGLG